MVSAHASGPIQHTVRECAAWRHVRSHRSMPMHRWCRSSGWARRRRWTPTIAPSPVRWCRQRSMRARPCSTRRRCTAKAERTLGAALESRRSEAVVATKVWTDDDVVAEHQIAASLSFYGGHIELLQIHNMVRWPERLRRIEELRDSGQVTLVGATHWKAASFDELEAAMVTGRLDAIQIPYNPREREVEDRLLPLAAELGLGVLIMRPFAAADLMRASPSARRARTARALRHPHVGTGVAAVGTEPPGDHRVDPRHVEAEQGTGERHRRRRHATRRRAPPVDQPAGRRLTRSRSAPCYM